LLALYGGRDVDVPAPPNAEALQRAMRTAGNRDASIEILSAADHDGLDPATQDGDLIRFVPGDLDRPLRWVQEHVGRR
jgi:hypothetical protein